MTANSFVKNVKNKATLEQLIVPFLGASKVIHLYISKPGIEIYRQDTFQQTLRNIIEIFKELEETILYKHLCELLSDC